VEITYLNEWTWAASFGRLLLALAFAGGLASTIGYVAAVARPKSNWRTLGRWGFKVHAVGIFGAIGLIYLLIFSHRYEFQYIWKHLNDAMPTKLAFASFWGGQEGGFLLWMFWILLLAIVFLRRLPGKLEAPVMAIHSGVLTALSSMLLGLYFGDFQFGMDPFLMLREAPENVGMPWTFNPDYLALIPQFADGQGLNPLLQNYWMVIHPPTLFLGFASTLMPFTMAIAGLWMRDHKTWMRAAIGWSFFGVAILGAGILMGGAWAYEALSFGGFWAWDPVENSSLVPWLVLVAGSHLLLINRSKPGTAVTATYLMVGLSFLLVVYSTFLTKSGILGDTSVHSFVDSGILPQLLAFLMGCSGLFSAMLLPPGNERKIYCAIQVALAIGVVVLNPALCLLGMLVVMALAGLRGHLNHLPRTDQESPLWTREFWMFVGGMLMFASAVHITFQTSLPVFNHFLTPFSGLFQALYESTGSNLARKLAAHNLAPGTDFDATYHAIQVPLAFLFIGITAFTQYLRYGKTPSKKRFLQPLRSLISAVVLTFAFALAFDFQAWEAPRVALIFSCLWSVIANADYIVQVLKGKWDHAGASVAHIGFALVILGAVVSNAKKDVISSNQFGDLAMLNEALSNEEDLLLLEGDTLAMGPYYVCYRERRQEGIHAKFSVDYFETLPEDYAQGEVVAKDGFLFQCTSSHTALPNFEDDMEEHWTFVPIPNDRQKQEAQPWSAGRPGPYLFTLDPKIQLNEQMGNAPEPDTKRFWNKDLYTHIKWGRVSDPEADEEGWMDGRKHDMMRRDSLMIGKCVLALDSISAVTMDQKPLFGLLDKDLSVAAHFRLTGQGPDTSFTALYIVRDSLVIPDMVTLDNRGVKVRIDGFRPAEATFETVVWENLSIRRDFIVMQATVFPQINLLWLGCIIMTLGALMSVRQTRRVQRKRTPVQP
jgi:cytochrome c-type biogenesis protein CcmF